VSQWYETAFGTDYLELYSHRDDEEALADVRALIRLIRPRSDAPLLDLGCGAGRHLVALHRAGYRQLTGLDLSQELLDVASERLRRAGAEQVQLIRSDMRTIPFDRHFATILSMFTSFGYFAMPSEDARVLTAAFTALRPAGVLLIDTLNRDWTTAHLVPRDEGTVNKTRFFVTRAIAADGTRVEKEVRVLDPAGAQRTYRESVRMYTAEELTEMLRRVGFSDLDVYGSLTGDPHRRTSRRLIVVARRGSS
jgi:ubiquinone/menaquinone biosynthesis C-methylase UbiE